MPCGMNSSLEWDLRIQLSTITQGTEEQTDISTVMMVYRGRNANEAIDSIYKHYGYKTPVSY